MSPAHRMSYRPSVPQPIPHRRRTHGGHSPSPPAHSAYSRFSREGSDSGHSQGWSSPRPRSAASRSSGGHSSDLIFPMDPERGSNSGSSRQGSVEPTFLYETPCGNQPVWEPAAMPVCSLCGLQFRDHVPPPGRDRTTAICPPCRFHGGQEHGLQHVPDDFCETAGYHPHRGRPAERFVSSHLPQRQLYGFRDERRRVNSTAIHVIGRPFPSYGAPPSRQTSQPHPPSSWADPQALPHATPVVGSYRAQYQLPHLIAQVQQCSPPANNISRPRTADPYGVSSSSRYTHHRRQ